MKIISHRGLWHEPLDKNTTAAFDASIAANFGTETDVRDQLGTLVIAHDPPTNVQLALRDVLSRFDQTGLTMAINVKADGLSEILLQEFSKVTVDWFAFDMSIPEMIKYDRLGLPYYTRHSDIEPQPVLYDNAIGVWMDAFESEWIDASSIEDHLTAGKKVCVVSSELHGRNKRALWERIRKLSAEPNLMICTDNPNEAAAFFS